MTDAEILSIFKKTNALLKGHFKLSSGLHSPQYLQCARVFAYPEYGEALCRQLAGKWRDKNVTIVIGPALGGIIVAYEVARALGVKSFFAERVAGEMTLRRGFSLDKTDKVLIAEDVVTTGKSSKEVAEVVRSDYGCEVVGLTSIVDRTAAPIDFVDEFRPLIKVEVPVYEPQECPLCQEGIPLDKPGSRPG